MPFIQEAFFTILGGFIAALIGMLSSIYIESLKEFKREKQVSRLLATKLELILHDIDESILSSQKESGLFDITELGYNILVTLQDFDEAYLAILPEIGAFNSITARRIISLFGELRSLRKYADYFIHMERTSNELQIELESLLATRHEKVLLEAVIPEVFRIKFICLACLLILYGQNLRESKSFRYYKNQLNLYLTRDIPVFFDSLRNLKSFDLDINFIEDTLGRKMEISNENYLGNFNDGRFRRLIRSIFLGDILD
jgi:hypothetical protein